jgi:perosamine synthetase
MDDITVPLFRWYPNRRAIGRAITRVIESGRLVCGPETERFEHRIAAITGRRYCVATCSCTTALYLVLRALGDKGQAAIPAITWPATANAALAAGWDVAVVDVNPETCAMRSLSVHNVEVAIPVLLYGGADVLRGLPKDTLIVLDAAHALDATWDGRPAPSYGHAAVLSFYATKAITTGGEGGAVVTDDEVLARRVRAMRCNGVAADVWSRWRSGEFYRLSEVGMKLAMTEIQAAIGLVELEDLELRLRRRRGVAKAYVDVLESRLPEVRCLVDPLPGHACHLFPVVLPDHVDRDRVARDMRRGGIGVGLHYRPFHTERPYVELFGRKVAVNAEAVGRQLLSLPLYAGMTTTDVEQVVGKLVKAVRK